MKAKGLILTAAVVVFVLSEHVSAELIAHYKFDDGSGLVALDSVSGNNGTIKDWNDSAGGPKGSWVAGRVGGAYNFNGTDSSDTPSAALDGLDHAGANPSNVTVAYWKKANNLPNDDTYPYAEDFQIQSMNLHSWSSWNKYVNGGTVYHSINAGSGWADQTGFATSAEVANEWHHYALVKDHAAGTTKAYLDGSLQATNSAANAKFAAPGKFDIGSGIWGGARLNGALDDFRIYNTSLTDAEVAALAAIPEPATMALMGLGSLLALLRRKR
jgi:hypothetical protein